MRRLMLVAAAIPLLAVSCGGSDDADDGPVRIEATDFEFDRDTVRVSAGAEVAVEVRNTGSIEHTWTVLGPEARVATSDDVEPVQIVVSVEVDAAQLETATFTAPGAGEYQIICLIPGHLEAGMEATLEVES